MVSEARRIGRGEYRQLRVGVLTGFSGRVARNAASDFAASHPNVQLSLACGTHEALFQRVTSGQLDLVVNDQRRALAGHFVNEELGDQPLYAMLRQDCPQARLSTASMEDLKEERCVVVAEAAQRESEAAHWRDAMAFSGDLLFADSLEEACLNVAAGAGWLPCDHDLEAVAGTAKVPLASGGSPLNRKMFAFWLEERSSPLHWEFTETLLRHYV